MRKAFLLAAALAALGAAPAAPQSPAVVNVRLSNFDFEPGTIVLDRRRSYVFRLYNASSGGHDFTASDFFRAANVAPADRRWIRDGSVEVPPGQVRQISLSAPPPGSYKLKCTHRLHHFLGMGGTIIVR